MKSFARLIALMSVIALVSGDVYMHVMRGSNNRLNEANTNRNNNNRMFNSQNNAQGGYCWGPAMSYYEGSQISLEWTSQHGCGSSKLLCQIVIQYMCGQYNNPKDDPAYVIRDGSTTAFPGTNGQGAATDVSEIATNQTDSLDGMGFLYGQHENFYYYTWCRSRDRNKGLYTADRNLNNNVGATATRQNNNGGQSGLECPEERDYHPYWHPSPWKDIAILVDDTSMCKYYKKESQNVQPKGYCYDSKSTERIQYKDWLPFNNEGECQAGNGTWSMWPAWGIPAPDCVQNAFQRENHLGNVGGAAGFNANYNWTIPTSKNEPCIKDNNCNCVLRLRYNISSADFEGFTAPFADSTNNNGNGAEGKPFLKQDPDLPANMDKCGGDGVSPCNVTLAIDTSQYARTFQDRSYVWHILKRPSSIFPSTRIYNLNVKGKRGNIVQVYPSTEYDFHPNDLQVRVGDYIHFQWTGCDTNPNGNAGEGKAGTDRSNIIQISHLGANVPASATFVGKSPLFENSDMRYRMTFLDQANCTPYEQSNNDQDDKNCMILNAASQHFDGGLVRVNSTGTYYYMSSRNNNFTNRGQKGSITIALLLPIWAIVLVVLGSAVFIASAGTAGAMIYAKKHPASTIARWLTKFS